MTTAQLKNHTILITGATGGLGSAMARLFLRRGARVLLSDRNEAELEDLAHDLTAASLVANLSDRSDITALGAWAATEGVTCLVNNAGIVSMSRIEDFPDADWDIQLAVNLTAVHLLTKDFVSHRIAQGGGGAIVNIASMSYKGMTRQAAYVASKGGVVSLTKATAMEMARHGVRANAIAPGMIETAMTNPVDAGPDTLRPKMIQQIPMRRYGEPEEVAATAAFLLSDDASYVTGEVIHVSGGARL